MSWIEHYESMTCAPSRRAKMQPLECGCKAATGDGWCGMMIKARRSLKRITVGGKEVTINKFCPRLRDISETP